MQLLIQAISTQSWAWDIKSFYLFSAYLGYLGVLGDGFFYDASAH
jgi:hypothetical protein